MRRELRLILNGSRFVRLIEPLVEHGEDNQRQEGRADKPSDDHDGEGPLHFRSDTVGKCQRNEAKERHQRRLCIQRANLTQRSRGLLDDRGGLQSVLTLKQRHQQGLLVEIPALPPVESAPRAASPLLPTRDSLLYGTLPLAGATLAAIMISLGVSAAARRIRKARISREPSRTTNQESLPS